MTLWACMFFNPAIGRLDCVLYRTRQLATEAAQTAWFSVYEVTVGPACIDE
jgi:hypothetical protein